MNLTIFESKKLEFVKSEIECLAEMIKRYNEYLEFIGIMQPFFLNHCPELEDRDRRSISKEIKSVEKFKKRHEVRMEALKELCTQMNEKPYSLYDQYYRINRFS